MFDTFEDGSPKPRISMRAVHEAQSQIAIVNEAAQKQAPLVLEQQRLAADSQRHADILRGQQETQFLQHQARAAHRAAGDDGPDRLRAAYIEAVRQQAEEAGLPFQEPVEEVPPELPKRNMGQSNGPSLDIKPTDNLRERFERAVRDTAN